MPRNDSAGAGDCAQTTVLIKASNGVAVATARTYAFSCCLIAEMLAEPMFTRQDKGIHPESCTRLYMPEAVYALEIMGLSPLDRNPVVRSVVVLPTWGKVVICDQ